MRLFIFAGEPSGDLHGSFFVHYLKQIDPAVVVEGVAGPLLRKEGVKGPLPMEKFSVMGLTDVLVALPRLIKNFFLVRKAILEGAFDGVLFIDSPAFSLRMAKSLKKRGFSGKIMQYVAPSVWAWGKERAFAMARSFDLLMTIYPFEKHYFSKAQEENPSFHVEYVGSPVKEEIAHHQYKLEEWEAMHPLVALFPGSRKKEIERNLPLMLEAMGQLKKDHKEIKVAISSPNKAFRPLIHSLLGEWEDSVRIVPKEDTYTVMRQACLAMAKSGTVTLELALHQCPTVVVYQLTWLNRLYAKYILKADLPFYCIVNILAGKEVFPELIREGGSPNSLYSCAEELFRDTEKRKRCLAECKAISDSLGSGKASQAAVWQVLFQLGKEV